jgi:hypothetical protein
VWQGPGHSQLLGAMFERPLEPRLRFPIHSREARYLRLTQVGRAETSSWTIAELVVRAPARWGGRVTDSAVRWPESAGRCAGVLRHRRASRR